MLGLAVYATPLAAIWIYFLCRRRMGQQRSSAALQESIEAGLTEPASLHPVVDPTLCIGCASCVAACPEMPRHQVLGIVHNKAVLTSPTDCIGHGACRAACPVDAISLVFGSEQRGVDIPQVSPTFESNVPGIFIAGELGGMGLIRNAIEQGRQAIESIRQRPGTGSGTGLDVLIVGAGPSGIAASLAARESELDYLTIEQDSLGGTVAHFPRRKLVMTSPAALPLVGRVRFTETTKEALLEFWQKVEREHDLRIRYGERVTSIERSGEVFRIVSNRSAYTAGAILLAIGRRGTPRKLGVPGEELAKVTYRLLDPEQYRDMNVLVVGGGDSAIESAITISEESGTRVTLSYRSAAFSRAKKKNRLRLEEAASAGRVNVLLESSVTAIGDANVEIEQHEQRQRIANEAVIINAGGILPTAFLREAGIEVETKYGTA